MPTDLMLPRLDPARMDWESAIRAALAALIPLLTLYALGRLDLGIYASFGAFTALYGRREPYRLRAQTLTIAGACVLASIVAGVLVQLAGAPWWLVAAGFVPVVMAGVLLTAALQWIPPGAVFFAFGYLGCAMRPVDAEQFGDAVLVAGGTVLLSWLLGMSGALLRLVPAVRARLRPLVRRPERDARAMAAGEHWGLIAVTLVASGLAGVAAVGLSVATHHYWAVVTVVGIFSAAGAMFSFERISHRVVGTLLGIGLAAALYGGTPHPLYVIAVVTVCVAVTELIIGQHYGFALTFITPLAIGAVNIGLTHSWETLFVDRARETLIGGAVCLVVVALLRRARRRPPRRAG